MVRRRESNIEHFMMARGLSMIKYVTRAIFLGWLGMAGLGLFNFSHASEPAANDVREIIVAAKKSHQLAQAKGHAWNVTSTYIEDAEVQLQAGQWQLAMVAAQRALKTADAAIEQASVEATAWESRVPGANK